MADPLLSMTGISKAYGPVRVLEDVGLRLERGEVRCIAGENGSGKSTLIKILSGIVAADAGEVTIAGRRMHGDSTEAIAAGLSVIYQDFSLFPNLTVAENIAFLRTAASGERWHRAGADRRIAVDTLARLSSCCLSRPSNWSRLPVRWPTKRG